MLKPPNRIQKDSDFRRVFKSSKPFYVEHLAIRALKTSLSTTRFGFVISNKIEKRATRRNTIKRRLREATRELLPEVRAGFDVIVIVKSPFDYPSKYQNIVSELRSGLRKSGLLPS